MRLPLTRVRAGTRWLRIHPAHKSAVWFGPGSGKPAVNRFDDPAGRFRICDLGTTMDVCFAETFLRNPPVRILAMEDLAERFVATVETTRDLRLVTLHGPGLARLGVTAELASGAGYEASRAWSRTVWEHSDAPDGIAYRSRHDDSALCIAIYHRAKRSFTVVDDRRLTDDPKLLARLLRKYDIGLTR